MRHPILAYAILFLLVLVQPAAVLHAQAPAAAQNNSDSLAGQLLVASPDMDDDRFAGAVILMIRDDKDGALGIIINQPVEDHSLADLLDSIGEADHQGIEGKVPVYAGGPVQPGIGFIIHSADYHEEATVGVTAGIALTSTPAVLRDIGHHQGPKKFLVAFGYAGWSPGQLNHEMADRAWAVTQADPALVFDADREQLWTLAWARRGINL